MIGKKELVNDSNIMAGRKIYKKVLASRLKEMSLYMIILNKWEIHCEKD